MPESHAVTQQPPVVVFCDFDGTVTCEDTLVLLKDPTVSKKHAAIKVEEGNRYELRDFSSTNGTRVNGEFIQRKFLKDGDRLNFGEVEVEFTLK